MKRIAIAGLMIVFLFTVGCRTRIKQDVTVNVSANELKAIDLTPAKSLTIEFSSRDNVPVTAVLVKTEDAAAALSAVDNKGVDQAIASAKSIAKLDNQTSGKLTTPRSDSKTQYSVLFSAKKDTSITCKIAGE